MMDVDIVIFIKDVKKGRTKNWLIFEVLVGFFDANRVYKIDFCGTDINSSIPFTDEQNESLKELLIKDFGYAPYDIDKAKKVIRNGRTYLIKK